MNTTAVSGNVTFTLRAVDASMNVDDVRVRTNADGDGLEDGAEIEVTRRTDGDDGAGVAPLVVTAVSSSPVDPRYRRGRTERRRRTQPRDEPARGELRR